MAQAETVYVMNLDGVSSDNADVGSKAIALHELMKANFQVPPGFVLTRHAFDKFAKTNKLEGRIAGMLRELNPEDFQSLRETSERIQALIMNSAIPEHIEREIKDAYEELSVGKEAKELGGVALDLIKAGRGEAWLSVRTSPIDGFIVHGKPILNVRGARKLSDAVKRCWASLFTPRAMFHRRKNRIEGFPSTGIVIQKMIDSDKSGTIFTYQPETQDRSRVVVEGIPGLGNAMLDMLTPDEYVLDKETGKVTGKRIRKKAWMLKRDALSGETVREPVSRRDSTLDILNDNELIKLWELSLKVERQLGAREIEWCMERGRIFILHSKPIREMPVPMEEHRFDGKPLAHGIGIYPGFVRGSAKVVLGQPDLGKLKDGDILVTMMTSDVMIPAFRKVSGIITDSGGRTCHAARLAMELGIPCVVGAETITTQVRDDQEIGIDGINGRIYLKEPDICQAEPQEPETGKQDFGEETQITAPAMRPPGFREDFTATQVKVNITLPDMAEKAKGSDGVGMMKAEHLLSGTGRNPFALARESPEEFSCILHDSLDKVARTIYPKPVFYRSLDVRSDDFTEFGESEEGEELREANPLLGWHGIRRSLDEPEVFGRELDVLRRLQQNGMNNVVLLLPFISSVDELRRVRGLLDFPIKTGIMVETPAAALNIENFCREGIDVVSIGSDELAQLVLGIDRDNPNVSRLYRELDPAMLNLIRHVVSVCRKHGVSVSVSGDIGNDPKAVERLVELGVDSITSDPESLERIREAVARTERRLILDRARREEQS